jgi:KTSC domain
MPSSVIRDYEYDADIQQLEITFVSGKVYVYGAVPEDVFEDFLAASSKGEFFNAHIRGAYAYREIMPAR